MLVKTYDKTLHTMAGFKLSADRQSILFISDMRYEFGAPISGRYAIFNISSQTVEFLDDLIKANYTNRKPQIQFATWGPATNSIIFIESNDIYYIPDFSRGRVLRVTKTGALSESIRNGLPDSLYRVNIFNQPNEATLWWSPDGKHLAFLSFSDALVDLNPIEYYDSYLQESNNNPKIHQERYARAGGTNPRVAVHVVNLESLVQNGVAEMSEIFPPTELVKQLQSDSRLSFYVTHVGWLAGNNNQIMIMWSNRAQTSSMLSLCEDSDKNGSSFFGGPKASSWKCETLTTFNQRIPPSTNAKQTILTGFNTNGTRLIFFSLPRPDSVIGDHFHVAILRGDDRAPKYLTHGEFDVDRLIMYEPQTDTLYFEVTISEKAERHLYKITDISEIASRQTTCLTCELDEPCGYNHVHISPGAKFLVHECLGPSVPVTRMRVLDAHLAGSKFTPKQQAAAAAGGSNATQGSRVMESRYVLGRNENLESLVRTKQMPIEKFIAIKTNDQVPCDVYMKLYLPNEIEEEKDKRFPLLIESSEIDQRKVWKKFDLDWGKYLASRKQLIYAKVDCLRTHPKLSSSSGSGNRWTSPEAIMAGGSGGGLSQEDQLIDSPLFNAKDQVDMIKFIVENTDLFPYVDRRRIAIFGPTSTSAYVALATTIHDESKLIQCTVAVSPITNWRYMSSYAAEHYLGLPWIDTNSLKYERTNLLKRSYAFSMRKLLIVHGTADEQVHVQHSMQFLKSLTDHHIIGGVLHQMQLYPDVGHSLEQVKRHYYLTLDGFIDRCFYQKPITIKATEWKGKNRQSKIEY